MSSSRASGYAIGQGIEYFTTFTLPDGTLVNPHETGTVTLTLTGAGLAVPLVLVFGVDTALINPSVGRYEFTRAGTEGGTIVWKWQSTGTVIGAEDGSDKVRRSRS